MKAAFFVTTTPGDEPRIQTMLGYAMAAKAMDYDVLVFLALDGGMLTKKKVVDNLKPETRGRIFDSMKLGVQIWVCSSAVATYGIKKEDMIEGIEVRGIASFFQFASESDVSLSWQ